MKHISKYYPPVLVLSLFAILTACANLPENTELSQKKKTELGLYLTATEAYELLEQDGANNNIMFDVRTVAEVKEGAPTLADANVPIFFKQPKKVVLNQDFVNTIEKHLTEKGLNKESTIIMICRQGSRSVKAVNELAKQGYKKVYTVVDGTNGWKEDNLPWYPESTTLSSSNSDCGCISDGSFCEDEEPAPIEMSRKRRDDEVPRDDVGCIMPSVVE